MLKQEARSVVRSATLHPVACIGKLCSGVLRMIACETALP